MKKALIVLAFVGSIHIIHAQKTRSEQLPGKLFKEGTEMYERKNYAGCRDILRLYKLQCQNKQSANFKDADFMILASDYHQSRKNAQCSRLEKKFKEFLEAYPETRHRNQIYFFIGSLYFQLGSWQSAIEWFSKSDLDYLSEKEQSDYSFRYAYSVMQWSDKDSFHYADPKDAKRLFKLLIVNSPKYRNIASYYYATIIFNEGDYEQALPIFDKLKNLHDFEEDSKFRLIQGKFIKGNLTAAINDGNDYISSYPISKNNAEVYRILGNSYYHIGNMQRTIECYESYQSSTKYPFREDMYQMANAYYKKGNYDKAAKALETVVSTNDKLGQNGYLLLGECYLKINKNQNASMAFDAAARSNFDKSVSEEALYNYVMMLNKESVTAFGQTVSAFEKFYSKYPYSIYKLRLNKALASTLLACKNYELSISVINRFKNPDIHLMTAKQILLYELGIQKYIDHNYNEALVNFNKAIYLGNYNMEIINECYYWKGEIAYLNKDYNLASSNFAIYILRGAIHKKNYLSTVYNLGYTRYQLNDYNGAISNFEKYILFEPNHQSKTYQDALNRLGDCNLYIRNFSKSVDYYTKAIESIPASGDYAAFQKGFTLGLQKNYKDKIIVLDNMMANYPSSRYYNNALFEKSRALVMLNNNRSAIKIIETLLERKPNLKLAQKAGVQLGQLYFNANNSEKAAEVYKHVIMLSPNTDDARIAIQSLESVYKDMNDIKSYANYVNSLGRGTIVSASREDSLTFSAAENVFMKNKTLGVRALNDYLKDYPLGMFTSDTHFYLGDNDFKSKNMDSALKHFKAVISSKNPKYMDNALLYASGIEFDNKNYQNAYDLYQKLNNTSDNEQNRQTAQLGMLRCAYLTNNDAAVIKIAKDLLSITSLSRDNLNEAFYYRAKAYEHIEKYTEALSDFRVLGKDTRNVYGAEAQFRIAEIEFKLKEYSRAEAQILAFMKAGTPHDYWMARSVIILSDVYARKNDRFEAKQYLESLQANYKGNDSDIKDMISQRLSRLKTLSINNQDSIIIKK